MEESKLLELGFENTSYTDEENNSFTEFTLDHEDGFKIQVSGEDYVEIFVDEIWIHRGHWNQIDHIKKLINLFSLPFQLWLQSCSKLEYNGKDCRGWDKIKTNN